MLTRRGRHNEADDFIGEVKSYLEVSDRLFDRAAPYFARHDRDNVLQIAQGSLHIRRTTRRLEESRSFDRGIPRGFEHIAATFDDSR